MPVVKITDDNNMIVARAIKGYRIIPYDDSIVLELRTDDIDIKYQIRSDLREPYINKIETFIVEQLDKALLNQTIFSVSEYLKGSYIFIEGNAGVKQFTAQKL